MSGAPVQRTGTATNALHPGLRNVPPSWQCARNSEPWNFSTAPLDECIGDCAPTEVLVSYWENVNMSGCRMELLVS